MRWDFLLLSEIDITGGDLYSTGEFFFTNPPLFLSVECCNNFLFFLNKTQGCSRNFF